MADGLIGAIIGGVLVLASSFVAIKMEQQNERHRFWRNKQYEIFSLTLEFLYGFLSLMGERLFYLEDVQVSFEEECAHLSRLEKKFRPQMSIVFEIEDITRIIEFSDDISQGVTAKKDENDPAFKTTVKQLEEFIEMIKKKYLLKK